MTTDITISYPASCSMNYVNEKGIMFGKSIRFMHTIKNRDVGCLDANCDKKIGSERKKGLGKISLHDRFIVYRHLSMIP